MKESIPRRTKHFYSFGPFRLYMAERELFRGDKPVTLSPKALDTLSLLVSHRGHVVGKDEFMTTLWPDTFVEEASLVQQISQLRKTLGEGPDGKPYIETVARRGYRFAAGVTDSWDEEPADSRLGVVGASEEVRSTARRLRPRVLSLAPWVLLIVVLGIIVAMWRRGAPEARLTAVPLTSYPGWENTPSFSPDGNQVALSWDGENQDNFDIYVQVVGAGEPLGLTNHPAADVSPAWSPDGRHIAFLRRFGFGGKAEVLLIPALGGPERKLTEVSPLSSDFRPFLAWAPDGKWLVVADRATSEEPFSLFLLSVETLEKRRLTTPASHFYGDSQPAFAPDGRTLAFSRSLMATVSNLYLLEVSKDLSPVGEPKQLTVKNTYVPSPVWTPDGREIVFNSGQWPNVSLWRTAASGPATPEQLGFVREGGLRPVISRQGHRLAYERQSLDLNIWRMEVPAPGGTNRPPLKLLSSTRLDWRPAFSPDGERIAFCSDRSGSWQIWLSDSDGSNSVQLTSYNNDMFLGSLHWSPDGKRIVFDARVEGETDIFVIGSEGGSPRRLTVHRARDDFPSWSSDGRWVYFTSNRNGKSQVWKMQPDGGEALLLTPKGGVVPLEGPEGNFLYYLQPGYSSPSGLWRIPVEGGEESRIYESRTPIRGFAVLDRGIYFQEGQSVKFLRFATSNADTIARIDKQVHAGFAVSPDGKYVLYTQIDQWNSDLMLVENFR